MAKKQTTDTTKKTPQKPTVQEKEEVQETPEVQEKYEPFRLTRMGHLRPFGGTPFNDPDSAAQWAMAQRPNSEGERITVLPVLEYAGQGEG